jgi:hypothetical protein
MENPNNNTCQECGAEIWVFMVKDEIWQQAGLKPTDILCQTCTATHLGRLLVLDDFNKDAMANYMHVPGFAAAFLPKEV